jgi:hypothetical protein
MVEPLTPPAARKLLRDILETGRVDISPHAWTEMANDGLTAQDVYGVLRGGVVEPEFERGSWRHRVRQGKTYVVVTFRSETWTIVVTAWRTK